MILQNLGSLLWTLLFLPLFLACSILLIPGFFRLLKKRNPGYRLTACPKHGALSGFQAAATTLAATVGTGNIIGTAQAIAMGGPGAVFWMWAAGILGFFVKCAEIWFGQKNARGAAGTIDAALGKRWADFYALLAVLSTLFVGNMAQMNTVISSVQEVDHLWTPGRMRMSLLLLIFLGLALYCGISSLGKLCTYLVPCMTLLYLLSACFLLLHSRITIPSFPKKRSSGAFEEVFFPTKPAWVRQVPCILLFVQTILADMPFGALPRSVRTRLPFAPSAL